MSAQTLLQVDTVRTWRGRFATGGLPDPRRPFSEGNTLLNA
ncbi:hypothetical protein [Streptomyces sp. NBC_00829]|nr:hypothetical protein OG293_36135 [Streptomyces sp. NBC_00829]